MARTQRQARRPTAWIATVVVLATLAPAAAPQAPPDANTRLREAAARDAFLVDTVRELSDRFPARLTGSPQAEAAARWAAERLAAWGLANVRLEPWAFGTPGWSCQRATARIAAPIALDLSVKTVAWTPGTSGLVRAAAVLLVPPDNPTAEELRAYLDAHARAVRGRIVLVGAPAILTAETPAPAYRLADTMLRERYGPRTPRPPQPVAQERPGVLAAADQHEAIDRFLRTQGAVARVWGSRDRYGLIRAVINPHRDPARCATGLVLTHEDYGRIARLLDGGTPVELELDVAVTDHPAGRTAYHVFADIPGRERQSELVMLGAHLDSHHIASGASDNAAGAAIAMEAARLIRNLGIPLRRTVRLALWSGEEQRVAGSQDWVRRQFGSFEDPEPAFPTLSAYFNLDNGSGRIRGMHIFGPAEAADVLRAILKPFEADGVVGATTYRNRTPPGSDHAAFSVNGLPGVWIDQDPLDYTLSWHSSADTFERFSEADARQAALVLAAAVYHVAQRDDLLPRFDRAAMPAPGSR